MTGRYDDETAASGEAAVFLADPRGRFCRSGARERIETEQPPCPLTMRSRRKAASRMATALRPRLHADRSLISTCDAHLIQSAAAMRAPALQRLRLPVAHSGPPRSPPMRVAAGRPPP